MSITKEKVATCSSCGEALPDGLSDGFCPKCALGSLSREFERSEPTEAPQEPRDKAPERIGKYRILREIGEGGFGIVYLAEQKEPIRRRVALKVLKRGMDTRQVVTRFEVERQALALMDHPNVAKVLDGGETEDGRPYFAMEYVEGVPITNFCDDHQMPITERLELLIQVCRGLQHCHQKGLIHRDVKPPNLLVTMQDGRPMPKIIDFGIAKVTTFLTQNTLFTDPGKRVGTPVYMSPEQLRLDSHDVDVRTDIYSIGALLYELLTGATPFDHRKLMAAGYGEMERTIREQEPPKPSIRLTAEKENIEKAAQNRSTTPARLKGALRRELDWIVMRAMAKSRERRYQSASDLADDLTRYLKGDAVKAGPPTMRYRASKFARRHNGRLAAVAAVLLISVGMIAYHLISRRKAEAELAVEMLTGPDAKTGMLRFYLPKIRPHLDSVADELEAFALDGENKLRARLHAAIAVLPQKPKPEVLSVLIDGLLALNPTHDEESEDLEDFLLILKTYRDEREVAKEVLNTLNALNDRAWKVVDEQLIRDAASEGNGQRQKTPALAAVALLAKLDSGSPRWKPDLEGGLLRKAVRWAEPARALGLSHFRQFVVEVLHPVYFPDRKLQDHMVKEIGGSDGQVMDFDLLTLRDFKSESKGGDGIENIKGLEMAVNLKSLDFDSNLIGDLQHLSGLTKLEELDLEENHLTDLSPLAGMKSLEMLDIRAQANKLTNLSALKQLTSLKELQISDNDLSKFENLKDILGQLVSLEILEMEGCQLSDISFVAKLEKLETLKLRDNRITDVTPLAGLKKLKVVDISRNLVKDLLPLLELPDSVSLVVYPNPEVDPEKKVRFDEAIKKGSR